MGDTVAVRLNTMQILSHQHPSCRVSTSIACEASALWGARGGRKRPYGPDHDQRIEVHRPIHSQARPPVSSKSHWTRVMLHAASGRLSSGRAMTWMPRAASNESTEDGVQKSRSSLAERDQNSERHGIFFSQLLAKSIFSPSWLARGFSRRPHRIQTHT